MKQGFMFALALSLTNTAFAFASEEIQGVSPTLLSELNTWLDAETEFARRDHQPRIKLVEPTEAEALRGAASTMVGRTRGLYDEASDTIYLTAPWSADNQRDVSILLHEMVHQRQSGQHWYCPQAQEWRAYQIQAQWLNEHDIEDGFYWPAILLQSSCAKRDIHSG